ncbi:MAG: PAS domain-containing sensor histidine kinase [Bacteroidetes bacterium]|nr:PAS domain-containing sensor histidine kinase [Bacteroidota bacterium]
MDTAIVPFLNDKGKPYQYLYIQVDITAKKETEEAIKAANENLKISVDRLNEAQKIGNLGSWLLDMKTNKALRTPEFYKIFESSMAEFPTTVEGHLVFYHPEDRKKIYRTYLKALKDHQPYQCEARLVMKDGTIKNVIGNGRCVVDEDGELIRMYGTIQDITERKKTELELERSVDELKKSNLELDKFVYSVSHDLRVPLSSMLGLIDITTEQTPIDVVHFHLGMIKTNIKKLDGFIADILDYSRNSRTEIRKEKINFKDLLDDITQNLKFMGADKREVDIKINISDKAPFHSDKTRLSFILNNLVSNAIRYQNTENPHPIVDIMIDTTESEIGIAVKDNGIGIKKELQPKIFDMFYRVSSESVGSGLGLYIVQEAVNKLNGIIAVESEVGEGSTFTIKIPNNN